MTRGPLAHGLLSNHLLEKASAAVRSKGYLNYSFGELAGLLPLLKEKLASARSFTEIALQYNLANPAVTSIVTGASSVDQLQANAAAVCSSPLTNDEVELIRSLAKANRYTQHR